MKAIILTIVLLSLSGCEDKTLEATRELALSAYECGYSQGYLDGMDGNYRPAERAAEIRRVIWGGELK